MNEIKLIYYIGYVWESLFIVYLSLSSHISTFDKICRCLEELIKIAYDPPLSYFHKLFLAHKLQKIM